MTLQKMILALSIGLAAYGQTQIDLSTQSKKIDFTAAAATLPVKRGPVLPATCQPAELFFNISAAAGSNLYGCVGINNWVAQSGGSLQDTSSLRVTYGTAQTLVIGVGCTAQNPCNVRFGNTVSSIQNAAVATLAAGTGQAFIYVSSAGVLTVGHTLTVACSGGCVAQPGVSAFPADSIPLYRWTGTSGAWDAEGGTDFRAFLSGVNLVGGGGVVSTNSGGATTIAVDTAVVPMRVGVPATSTSSCTAGTWALSSTFFYTCVAANTWARAGVASW